MRLILTTAAALALLAVQTASAADSPDAGPPAAPPRVFTAAGYAQPDITPGLCRNVNAQITQCVIPEMTAGRYLIQVTGTSTAQTADAVQQITIRLGDTTCAQATRRGTDQVPWRPGTAQTFKLNCVVTIVTDHTLTVAATYADLRATKDSRGPTLSLRRLPWTGVLAATPVTPEQ